MISKRQPLSITNPDLVKEWDLNRNTPLTPDNVSSGSTRKVWWKCSWGHVWEAVVYSRVYGSGCPYCSNRKTLSGFNDLATVNPKLAEEWNYDRNLLLSPSQVLPGSNKKVWWLCKEGHEWSATISSRARGLGCPFCSGERVLVGYNDLSTVRPELAKEWDYEKNSDLKPTDVTVSSGKKVWWKCEKGHSWYSVIANRSKGSGCRVCQRENQTSFPEQAIYYYILRVFPDAENGNITVLDGQELDVYIPSRNIGIEFDGGVWHRSKQRDIYKNKLCKDKKIILYRIRDIDCPQIENNKYVHEIELCSYKDDSVENMIRELTRRLGYEIDINIARDRADILSQYISRKKEQSVATNSLVSEWDYEKNGRVTPDLVYIHSGQKYWWKCSQGHEWIASPDNRAKGKKCPYCSGRRAVTGQNDLETLRPDLVEEWDYSRNIGISPSELKPASGIDVWWKCKKCGFEWKSRVANRSNGYGCPNCGRDRSRISKLKPVLNIDTGVIFDDASAAAVFCGLKTAGPIRSCCIGNQKTAGGYHWKYVDS